MSHGLSERSELSGLPSHAQCAHGVDLAGRYQVGSLVRTDGRCCTHEGHDTVLRRAVSVTLATPESGIPIPRTLPLPTSARYRHGPGLGEIYDGGDDHGTVYLVTQPPEGANLAEELRDHRLTSDEVRDLGAGIARALLPAHRHGWAHGALEADTVGLGPDRVTVAGLGVGEWLSHWAQVDDHPHYPAPEQLAEHKVSPATDVFALGALLAEAAEPLPPEDSLGALLRQMCSEEPDERPTTEQVIEFFTTSDQATTPRAAEPPVAVRGTRGRAPSTGEGRTGPAITAIAGLVVAAALTLATVVVRTSDAAPGAFVGGATVATDSAAPALPAPLQFLIPPVARKTTAAGSTRGTGAVAVVAVTGTTDAPAEGHRASSPSPDAPATSSDRGDRGDRSADEHRSSDDVTTSPAETTASSPTRTTSPRSSDSSDSSKPTGADRTRPKSPSLPGHDGPGAGNGSGSTVHRRTDGDSSSLPKVDPTADATVTVAPGDPPSTTSVVS